MPTRISLAILLLAVLAHSPASAELVQSWEEAQTIAAEKGVLIVVDFFADWCSPCKRFDKALEDDAKLKATIDGVVFLQTDAEKEGKELAGEFLVGGYPTYVVANAEGETLGRWWGFESADAWVAKFDAVMADPTTMVQKAERHERSPNATDAFVLGRYHETREEYDRGIELYGEALKLDPQQSEKYEDALFEAAYSAHRDEKLEFTELARHAEAIHSRGDEASGEDLYSLARMMTMAAHREEKPELAGAYITQAMDRLAGDDTDGARERHDRLAIDHAMIVEKDADKAVELKKASYDEGWLRDSDAMNGFAWWCFENGVNLIEAEKIGRAAVELAESDGEKAQILDTVAEICNARGDCRDAVSLIEQAIELNPGSDYYKKQLVRFQKILESTG